jgi:hypothetical protein
MHAYSYSGDRLRAFGLLAFLAVVVAIGANALAEKFQLGPPWLISAPTVAAAFGLLYSAMDRWAWKWRALRAVGVANTPIVAGHYVGTLRSSWDVTTDIPIVIDVDQSWNRLIVRFEVTGGRQSSQSFSLAASLNDTGQHQARLTYMYRNSVRPGHADADMNDHDGTAELEVDTTTGMVSGRYYNYRGRQGTLELSRS